MAQWSYLPSEKEEELGAFNIYDERNTRVGQYWGDEDGIKQLIEAFNKLSRPVKDELSVRQAGPGVFEIWQRQKDGTEFQVAQVWRKQFSDTDALSLAHAFAASLETLDALHAYRLALAKLSNHLIPLIQPYGIEVPVEIAQVINDARKKAVAAIAKAEGRTTDN